MRDRRGDRRRHGARLRGVSVVWMSALSVAEGVERETEWIVVQVGRGEAAEARDGLDLCGFGARK